MAQREKDHSQIIGVNMTRLFTRDAMMHSFGDIRLSSPISLKKALYTMFFFAVWSLPWIVVVGFSFLGNLPMAVIIIGPPFLLAWLSTSNFFGGKNLIDFVKTQYEFFRSPRGWEDLNSRGTRSSFKKNEFDQESYYINNPVLISRRSDLRRLQELSEGDE